MIPLKPIYFKLWVLFSKISGYIEMG